MFALEIFWMLKKGNSRTAKKYFELFFLIVNFNFRAFFAIFASLDTLELKLSK